MANKELYEGKTSKFHVLQETLNVTGSTEANLRFIIYLFTGFMKIAQ